MKRIIIAIGLALLAALATFAQGTFLFSGNSKSVWDNYSTSLPHISGETLTVAFLFGTGTPKIAQIGSSVATNAEWNMYITSTAWSDILGDPNYTLATSGGTNIQASVITSYGAWIGNGNSSYLVTGSTGGATYTVYVIAWDSAYATPAAAQAADAAVGWSAPFTYFTGNPNAQPPTSPQAFNTSVIPFGVLLPIPEPSTLALAGVGIASLFVFRDRRK